MIAIARLMYGSRFSVLRGGFLLTIFGDVGVVLVRFFADMAYT